jgi:hypothetical protein
LGLLRGCYFSYYFAAEGAFYSYLMLFVREVALVFLAIYFSASGIIHSFFGTNSPLGDFFSSFLGSGIISRFCV